MELELVSGLRAELAFPEPVVAIEPVLGRPTAVSQERRDPLAPATPGGDDAGLAQTPSPEEDRAPPESRRRVGGFQDPTDQGRNLDLDSRCSSDAAFPATDVCSM